MSNKLEDDLRAMRERESQCLLPLTDVFGIRVTKCQAASLKTRALETNTGVSTVIRLFLLKGAEQYGYDLSRIA